MRGWLPRGRTPDERRMRKHKLLLPILVFTAGCAASTYPLNPQLAAQAGLEEPSFLEKVDNAKPTSFLQKGTCSWYGPGFYGRRTACGKRLRRSTLGVANKRLPCGTPVTFYHQGRFITVKVIDRGPYRAGASWDLTAAAARRLGVAATTRLRAAH